LAEQGNASAIQALAYERGDRDETWDLVTALAARGDPTDINTLVSERAELDQTWDVVSGLDDEQLAAALGGSEWLNWDLIVATTDRPDVIDLAEELACQGDDRAVWALATVWDTPQIADRRRFEQLARNGCAAGAWLMMALFGWRSDARAFVDEVVDEFGGTTARRLRAWLAWANALEGSIH
jgi:hypothetical protein